MSGCPRPAGGDRGLLARSVWFLIFRRRRDPETRIRQRLNDAFRGLFGLLGTHRVVRAIFSGIAKCGRNDRNSLMGIGQSALLGFCMIRSSFSRMGKSRLRRARYPDRTAEASANYGWKRTKAAIESRRPSPGGSSSGVSVCNKLASDCKGAGCQLVAV